MEREETNSSHLCTSRTALWCPICGAAEGKGCTPVKGLRFQGHNQNATGQAFKPVSTSNYDPPSVPLTVRKNAGLAVKGWVN